MNLRTAKKILKKSGVYCCPDDQQLAQLYRWARDKASNKDIEHLSYYCHWNLGIYSGFDHGGKASTIAVNCAIIKETNTITL
jgi:hypothetical protein